VAGHEVHRHAQETWFSEHLHAGCNVKEALSSSIRQVESSAGCSCWLA
jgi:hypothetical protein